MAERSRRVPYCPPDQISNGFEPRKQYLFFLYLLLRSFITWFTWLDVTWHVTRSAEFHHMVHVTRGHVIFYNKIYSHSASIYTTYSLYFHFGK